MDDELSAVDDGGAFAADPVEVVPRSGGSPRLTRMVVLAAAVPTVFLLGMVAGAHHDASHPVPAHTVTLPRPSETATVFVAEQTDYGPATREQEATQEVSGRSATATEVRPPTSGSQQVGREVSPGEWVGLPLTRGSLCHWERIITTSDGPEIVAESLSNDESRVTIRSTDQFFFSHGCQWYRKVDR